MKNTRKIRKKSKTVYTNSNPRNTIPIRFKTPEDVQNTIDRLEHLYSSKRYSAKRIWQVALILKIRLEVMKEKKPEEFALAKEYLDIAKTRMQNQKY